MFLRNICLWSLLFFSCNSFAASIIIEVPDLSSTIIYAHAKLTFNNSGSTKTLYRNGDCLKNLFFVSKTGLYKVEITIRLSSGEILSDWANGYINSEGDIAKISATINPNCFKPTFSVFWVSDYVVNETDLHGFKLDSSLLKRVAIHNIDSIADRFFEEGLKWYSDYEVHDELLDSNFIPLISYSSGFFRNAITTCQTLLAFHSQYQRTGDSLDFTGFINNANWLANNNHAGYYLNEFDFLHDHGTLMKKNWVSAMAQGYAVGSLSYAYYVTHDSLYIKEADSVFVTLHQNSSDYWCFLVDNKGYYWLEEYPNEDFCHVLNGKMAALWGIFQYYTVSRNKLALTLLEAGIKSVIDNYRIWNLNNRNNSYYCLHHRIKEHYHSVHQTQLLAFANKFNIEEFYNAYYCFIDSSILVDPKLIQFSCFEEKKEISIESPQCWHVEEQAEWISTDTLNNKIIVYAESNLTNKARSAIIEVIFDNGDREQVFVTQEMQYYFSLGSHVPDLNSEGDTLLLSYLTNVPYFDVMTLSPGLKIDKISNNLRIICDKNESFSTRNFECPVFFENSELFKLTISQKAKMPFINLESDTVIINTAHIHEVKVYTNIPRIALLSFDHWLMYDWNGSSILIRSTLPNSTGRIYLDSPYLTKDLVVISGEYTNSEITTNPGIDIYPNPVRDMLQINVKNSGICSYEFRNLYGSVLESGKTGESASIDVSGYMPGVYFVVISTSWGESRVVKVIVQ